jgi:hypothetical protein
MKATANQAYSEILNTLKKYKDICVFDVDDLERKAKWHLFGIKLKDEFGLDIDPKRVQSLDWMKFGDYRIVGWFGEKYRRTISWSDNGTQPVDELLLELHFSTGAYIFGDDYPTNLFQKFFLELKSFNPKYIDSANHSLYFSMDNAKDVFNSFDSILKKYNEINKEDWKQRKIQRIEDELKQLLGQK